jgi:hypothetical protein
MLQVLDSDSSKIIEAVRSTGVVVTEAMRLYVDYIVSNMKAIGTWDLCNAVYGFVGGTADSHKWNWKDLRDVDAAFRLTPSSATTAHYTHNSNGVKSNNASAWFSTNLIANQLITDNNHLSLYVNTNISNVAIQLGFLEAILPSRQSFLYLRTNAASGYTSSGAGLNDQFNVSNYGSIKGYNLGNTPSVGVRQLYNNGIKKVETSTADRGTNIDVNTALTFLSVGSSTDIVNTFQFTSIGAGLTELQATQQSQIVTNAQNILNRA